MWATSAKRAICPCASWCGGRGALCRTSNEGSVYFFIDEFRLLPHLEHIDDGVNFGRSLGAKFFVGIQNIDQIAAAYGQNLSRSILSGFGTTLAFRVNDAGSREYIKDLFGRNIKLQTYLSAVQNRGVSERQVLPPRLSSPPARRSYTVSFSWK